MPMVVSGLGHVAESRLVGSVRSIFGDMLIGPRFHMRGGEGGNLSYAATARPKGSYAVALCALAHCVLVERPRYAQNG